MPAPDPYAPPLTRWAQTWRIALCVLISAGSWVQVVEAEGSRRPGVFWADLALGLVSFVLVVGRRRRPLATALLLAGFGALSASSAGPAALALVSLATRREVPRLVGVGVVSVAAGAAFNLVVPLTGAGPWWIDAVFSAIVTAALAVGGLYVGSRRELVWSLRDRADQAERQQELRVERARALERERIAREMHDVLAHRISLITMHAGALAYRTDLPSEQVRETAALISATSHEALVELREVLGVLRETEPTRPQPALRDLRGLVEEATASGTRVRYEDALPDPAGVPDRIGRTVYRLVQEGLTNARKHAPGAPVTVRLGGAPGDGLTVVVRNGVSGGAGRAGRVGPPDDDVAATGAGLGLVGMRERVELAGGRLDVRADPGAFVLEAWLPWPT